jgi:hypothetical protein
MAMSGTSRMTTTSKRGDRNENENENGLPAPSSTSPRRRKEEELEIPVGMDSKREKYALYLYIRPCVQEQFVPTKTLPAFRVAVPLAFIPAIPPYFHSFRGQ